MSAHTPGPWKHGHNGSKTSVVAWCTAGRQTVAECYVESTDDSGKVIGCNQSIDVAEANARLCSAAPELHELAESLQAVCARIIEQYGPVTCGVDFAALGGAVNRVLAKVEGVS